MKQRGFPFNGGSRAWVTGNYHTLRFNTLPVAKETHVSGIEAFRGQLATDANLQAQVRQAIESGCGPEELVSLAGAHGFTFTANEAVASFTESELSDFELEMVAGGKRGFGRGFGFGRRGW